MGVAFEKKNNPEEAKNWWDKATQGLEEPTAAIFYNDQQPDKIFYQGLAWKKLGDYHKAESIFKRLIAFGTEHLHDKIKIDYFAVSLPDLLVFDQDLDLRNKVHCHYLLGLGYMGLGNGTIPEAEKNFKIVLKNDINHFGSALHSKMIRNAILMES